MNWQKQGLIYMPNKNLYWQNSHAALPTKLHLGGSNYRIFFTSRDKDNRTFVGSFDIDITMPKLITNKNINPVLCPGNWGFFDDHGVQACSIIKANNGDLYMYYLGWNPGLKQPLFYTSIGLAISKDNGETFEKYSDSPIMQRSKFDPWMVSGGTVLKTSNAFIMYYLSGFKFEFNNSNVNSYYDIKIAHSKDGIEWIRNGDVALALKDDETNISRMSIVKRQNEFEAWFPLKKKDMAYHCAYATSVDGLKWHRKGDNVLPPSENGWDSEAIDKMEVIEHNNIYYMLYNGNKFGIDGIGLAIAYE